MHNFSSLLNITLHVSDGLSVHHQESDCTYSVRYMSYRFADCFLVGPRWSFISGPLTSSQRTSMTYTRRCMYSLTPDDGRKNLRNMQCDIQQTRKIVHVVGFTIEIYHDARNHEHKKKKSKHYLGIKAKSLPTGMYRLLEKERL